jgi:hypothetical protein
MNTLKDYLKDWTDMDWAMYDLGRCLGLMDTEFVKAKHVFWSENHVGNMLHDILTRLADNGILEYRDEPDYQYRWNPHFKGTWE